MTQHNDFVFHGTHRQGLKTIHPTDGHERKDTDKPIVFASRYKNIAVCFFFDMNEEAYQVFYNQNGEIYFVVYDPDWVKANDKGGSLYMLDGKEFYCTDKIDMGYMEWLAETQQQVVKETTFPSALQAMRDHGVHLLTVKNDIKHALQLRLGTDPFVILSDHDIATLSGYLDTHGKALI